MAFAIRNLSVLAYANGFTQWHYKAPVSDGGAVTDTNYFADAGDMFATGDMIIVSNPGGGNILFVTAVDGGVRTTQFGAAT